MLLSPFFLCLIEIGCLISNFILSLGVNRGGKGWPGKCSEKIFGRIKSGFFNAICR